MLAGSTIPRLVSGGRHLAPKIQKLALQSWPIGEVRVYDKLAGMNPRDQFRGNGPAAPTPASRYNECASLRQPPPTCRATENRLRRPCGREAEERAPGG